mmetsp:Transcript_82662/g.177087  ORF Transcript_82662/g.177087 Transcript_82662/m.177087 type:complete len:283 (-) Transcript_82662:1126-1974(-)
MATRVGGLTASSRGPSRRGASPSSSSSVFDGSTRGPATGMSRLSPPGASWFHQAAPLAPSSSASCAPSASSASSSASSPPSSTRRRRWPAESRTTRPPAARRRSASSTASTTSGSNSPPKWPSSSRTSSSLSLCSSPPSMRFRRSSRHASMRPRNSVSGMSPSTDRGEPSKGSTGPRKRSCSSMTRRSQMRPELGRRTGSDIMWLMSASRNSLGSFSPSLRPSVPPSRWRRSKSFWCSGTRSRPFPASPGRKRTATRIAKSRPATSPRSRTPSSPSFRCRAI